MHSQEAENLIFGTGLIESNYDYLRQWNDGVACSWWQIEPGMTGALDNIKNYLKYRPKLIETCSQAALVDPKYFSSGVSEKEIAFLLETNISYAIIHCRLKYRRVPKKLPKTIEGMGEYWKQFYNSELGKGKSSEFIEKYINVTKM